MSFFYHLFNSPQNGQWVDNLPIQVSFDLNRLSDLFSNLVTMGDDLHILDHNEALWIQEELPNLDDGEAGLWVHQVHQVHQGWEQKQKNFSIVLSITQLEYSASAKRKF